MVVSLSFPQKNIYASYLGESLSGENENLTEDEISRIKEMAKDTSYIRDEDDFDSIEAYNMYIKYCFVFINFNININVFPPFNAEGHCFAEDV